MKVNKIVTCREKEEASIISSWSLSFLLTDVWEQKHRGIWIQWKFSCRLPELVSKNGIVIRANMCTAVNKALTCFVMFLYVTVTSIKRGKPFHRRNEEHHNERWSMYSNWTYQVTNVDRNITSKIHFKQCIYLSSLPNLSPTERPPPPAPLKIITACGELVVPYLTIKR